MAISKRLYRLFSGTYNSPARLNKVYHKRFSVILVCVQSFVDNFRRLLLCPNPPPLEDNPLNPPYQGDGLALLFHKPFCSTSRQPQIATPDCFALNPPYQGDGLALPP